MASCTVRREFLPFNAAPPTAALTVCFLTYVATGTGEPQEWITARTSKIDAPPPAHLFALAHPLLSLAIGLFFLVVGLTRRERGFLAMAGACIPFAQIGRAHV